ncbi:MAG: ferritin-like domain-containing protein [Polyangiales bacterium]
MSEAASARILGDEARTVEEAIARTKRLVTRFDPKPYSDATLSKARDMWRVRMIAEYRSTAVFAALVPQLLEASAPMDATTVVLRMAQDEVAHARLCAEAVRTLGGDGDLREPVVAQPLPLHPGRSSAERVLRNVVYGCCLTEIVNCARFVDVLEQMSDPFFRDLVRRLLADERLHGQFGFHYLEICRGWLDDAARASMGRYLRYAFAVVEKDLSGAGSKRPDLTDEERAIGLPDPRRLPETFYATMEGAIVPGLERFGIEAEKAWRTRTLDPR